jgi:phage terminase large subunit-like protein
MTSTTPNSTDASNNSQSDSRLKSELADLLTEKERRRNRNRLPAYRPYAKQAAFHQAGAVSRERLFMAGNQLGKTMAGAAELAMHLTGRYPKWWRGRRFDRPIAALAGSETAELTRQGVQRLLLGPPADERQWGTGLVPGDDIVEWTRRRGVADAVDTIVVRHVSGGNSTALLKSYDQGRAKWQADTVHVVWFDEEPPLDVYSEGVTRTNATRGLVYLTFTPLLGVSAVVHRFLYQESPDRSVTVMAIDEALHYSAEDRARIVAAYPEHEREARARGAPALGSGRVFPVAEERIVCDPFAIPPHYAQIIGIDFGWDHPFAAVRCAWDRDGDVFYVVGSYREAQTTPPIHAAAIRPWGVWIPVAWPHDGYQHDKGSGDQLSALYRGHGLNMLAEHATHEEGGHGIEAGVLDMLERMQTGRFKVFRGLEDWLQEFRLYHRDKGIIVKERDDLLAATRYALMMRRFAETAARPKPRVGPPAPGGGWMG